MNRGVVADHDDVVHRILDPAQHGSHPVLAVVLPVGACSVGSRGRGMSAVPVDACSASWPVEDSPEP